jgi:hypothetical protein
MRTASASCECLAAPFPSTKITLRNQKARSRFPRTIGSLMLFGTWNFTVVAPTTHKASARNLKQHHERNKPAERDRWVLGLSTVKTLDAESYCSSTQIAHCATQDAPSMDSSPSYRKLLNGLKHFCISSQRPQTIPPYKELLHG